MIGFETTSFFWLVPPALLLWWLFVRIQVRAVAWLESYVAPRFRRRFSVYGRTSLWLHMSAVLVMGLALIVAAAGPFTRGKTEAVSATGRLLFLIDASASMWAEDVEAVRADAIQPADRSLRRMDIARDVAITLMKKLEGYRFALASFSGTSAIHLPMTSNLPLIEDALGTLEVHSYYRNTGSSITSALDVVPHFVDRRGYRLQVVVLSDGEQPRAEDYGAALAALAEQDVPVHTVAIGSTQGQTRRIMNFQDVVDRKESPRVLREFRTQRVDKHLKRISGKTGGGFFVAEDGVVDRLAEEVLKAGGDAEPFEHDAARSDLSGRYLLIFLAGLLLDTLWFGRRPRFGKERFDLGRLGDDRSSVGSKNRARTGGKRAAAITQTVVAVLAVGAGLLTACSLPLSTGEGGGPRKRAHRENERGITRDALSQHPSARVHYERSLGYGIESQIPAYNLARSVLLTGDYSEAHDLFQEALLLAPDLPEAHFNDAMTLYLWGQAERDPKNCDLERTRELWVQALRRFSAAVAAAKAAGRESAEIGDRARDNRRALAMELEEIKRLIADPPEECFSDSPQSSAAAGGSEAGGAGSTGSTSAGGSENSEGQGGGAGEGEDEEDASGNGGEPQEGEKPEQAGGQDPQPSSPDPEAARDPAEPDGEGGNGSSGGLGRGELTDAELDEIGKQLERLAEQVREPGKYHRRTLPEQFRKEDWANPDETIWW